MKRLIAICLLLSVLLCGCKKQRITEGGAVAVPGEECEKENSVQFTCGNTMTRIYSQDGEDYSFMGGDSVWLSQLLADLEYSPEKLCKCLPKYTVDTEYKTGYGIDLGETPYARCDKGQADLSPQQAERIEGILQKLRDNKLY